MKLPPEIENKIDKLTMLCDKYKVNRMFVFGSVVKGNFNPATSDVDFLVEIEDISPVEKGEKLMKFWSELEQLFARKVDLLTSHNIRNPYLKMEIENSKQLVYDRAG